VSSLAIAGQERLPQGQALVDAFLALKKVRNAVVLAHFYQVADIQEVADFVGDSLDLSRKAAGTKADVILFCGVRFMAETAKILSPSKKVVVPDMDAGCSLADHCPADAFRRWQSAYPGAVTLSYINCNADIKALSDVIVTSTNAKKIVEQIPKEKKILFGPDRNLGRWLQQQTGRDMVLWQGACIVHEVYTDRKITMLKAQNPGALVIAHPECEEAVLKHADFVGSTSALLNFAKTNAAKKFIVATEAGILHPMEKACPDKTFLPAPGSGHCQCSECPYMKLNSLEKAYVSLRDLKPEVTLEEELRKKALKPIERMLEMSN
jgi:quinolinate synthase